jgi:hypothetical protein
LPFAFFLLYLLSNTYFNFGSSASRRPLPRKLNPITVNIIEYTSSNREKREQTTRGVPAWVHLFDLPDRSGHLSHDGGIGGGIE